MLHALHIVFTIKAEENVKKIIESIYLQYHTEFIIKNLNTSGSAQVKPMILKGQMHTKYSY